MNTAEKETIKGILLEKLEELNALLEMKCWDYNKIPDGLNSMDFHIIINKSQNLPYIERLMLFGNEWLNTDYMDDYITTDKIPEEITPENINKIDKQYLLNFINIIDKYIEEYAFELGTIHVTCENCNYVNEFKIYETGYPPFDTECKDCKAILKVD